MGRALHRLLSGLSLVVALAPCAALAQPWRGPEGEPSAQDLSEARQLYGQGTAEVEAHRWADALASFERSYRLSGAGPALYSLAYTLRVLGRAREARDAFDQLLRAHPDLDAGLREEATRLRQEVAARVAVLRLAGLPDEPPPTILLDAAVVPDDGQRPLPVETDPGEHALRVEAAGFEPFTWRGGVGAGDRVTVEVSLEPVAEADPMLSHPIFWIAVGVGVIAAGVIVGAIIHQNAQLEPRTDQHIVL